MRIGHLECFAGISGDMLLGALADAGVPQDFLSETVRSLGLRAELAFAPVDRSGIRSLKARVLVDGREADAPAGRHAHEHTHSLPHEHRHAHPHDPLQHADEHPLPAHEHMHSHPHAHAPSEHADEHEHTHAHEPAEIVPAHGVHTHTHGRALPEIRRILHAAALTNGARALALEAFELLGRAESAIHGVALEEVHFHEVGAVDAIVDIACAAAGLDSLGRDVWYCSAVNVGGGFVDCAHGRFPVPAPATAELLKGIPTYSAGVQAELVTPTGAALLRALHCEFELGGPVRIESIGYGAGSRNPRKFPNVLRLSLGEERGMSASEKDTVTVLECAIDDLSPQVLAFAAQRALDAGALDAMSSAVQMKKGRMGTLLTVLCREGDAVQIQEMLFRETSTLGIRVRREERVVLARRFSAVETPFGRVRIKTGFYGDREVNVAPEFEDCRERALEHHVPVKEVMEAAVAAAREGAMGDALPRQRAGA